MIFEWQGKPFTGVAYELADNRLICELAYVDGVQHGLTQEWYPNGQLQAEAIYKNSSLHGHYREWFENGQLKTDQLYEFAVLVKKKDYDENGATLVEFEIDESHPQYAILEKLRRYYGGQAAWQ